MRARALPAAFRARAERVLGTSLAGVRACESPAVPFLGATALTVGRNLYFAPGTLRFDQAEGRRLVGHELTHVAQQAGGRVGATGRVGALPVNADPRLEAAADGAGRRIAEGGGEQLAPVFRPQEPAPASPPSSVGQMHADPARARELIDRMETKAVRYVNDNRGIYNAMFAQPVATAHNGLAAVQPALAPSTNLGVDVQDLAPDLVPPNAIAAGTPQIDSDLWAGKMQQANEGIFGNFREVDAVSRHLEQSHSTRLGATAAGVGGDFSVFEAQGGGAYPANRRAGRTVQAKYVSSANFGQVTTNLKEAATQLAGAHGETPPADHQRVIELTIGNPDNYWPLDSAADRAGLTTAQFTAEAQRVLSGEIPAKASANWALRRVNVERVEMRWDPDVFGAAGLGLGGGAAAASNVLHLSFRRMLAGARKDMFSAV